MFVGMWGKQGMHSLLVRVQTYAATVEISAAVSREAGNRATSRSSYNTPGYISKGYFILLQRHLLNHVH